MIRYEQSHALITIGAALPFLFASTAYASSAGVEIIFISIVFFTGILPAFLIGFICALHKKRTYLFSVSTSVFVALILLIAWAFLAWWKNKNAGFLRQLEWPIKFIPYTIIPAMVTNTITYWVVNGLKYIIKRRTDS